jgi:Peptidase A4 family
VQISKHSKGSASFSFLMGNLTTGALASFAKSTEHDFGPTYAAAVVEYPYTSYKAVSNFGTVTFTQVEANSRGFGAYNLDKDVMVDLNSSKSPTLATTGKLTDLSTGATYSVKYGRCN